MSNICRAHRMKENILFFYKSSHGELHAGLPILMKILCEKKELTAYFIYEDKAAFDNIPSFYKQIINDNFQITYLNKNNLFSFYIKHFYSKNYNITCDNGHTLFSRLLTYYWPFSRIVFFHHAYALLNGTVSEDEIKQVVDINRNYDGGHHKPLVIAHNELELDYRKKSGFHPKNIIIAGNLGYQKDWKSRLSNNSNNLVRLEELRKKYQKTIFIPTRDIHKLYLSKNNSSYLVSALEDIISSYPEYLFIIKPHPRQKDIEKYENIQKSQPNCVLTNLNTISVSEISDLVTSFWSSSIIDALAARTPVVEFHRHDTYHSQLVNTDQGLVSLYHHMNLCPFFTKSEEIKELLEDTKQWQEILREQQLVYKKIFLKSYPSFTDNLMHRLKLTDFNSVYLIKAFSVPVQFILKKIMRKAK